MENEILGLVLIGVMLFAIFIGFPISFTLIFLGFVFGYIGFGPLVFYLMTFQFSSVMLEQTLAAVPLFIFMGLLMEQAGLMERLFKAVQLMLSRVDGSLYLAVLFVSTIFAAATGIVGASVTILGIMAAKTMTRSGYDVRLSAGTITAPTMPVDTRRTRNGHGLDADYGPDQDGVAGRGCFSARSRSFGASEKPLRGDPRKMAVKWKMKFSASSSSVSCCLLFSSVSQSRSR